jgi:nucleoid-associated protein YejK
VSTQREQYERWIQAYFGRIIRSYFLKFLKALEGFDGAVGLAS